MIESPSRLFRGLCRALRLDWGRFLLLTLAIAVRIGLAPPRPAQAGEVGNPHGDVKLECATCHSPEAWVPAKISPQFDHSKLGPALDGAHGRVPCAACHKSLVFKQVKTACADCHQDPHRGELGAKCATCHTTRSFTERSLMEKEHALTRLPLTGAHVTLDCASCHNTRSAGRLVFAGLSAECAGCHRTDYDGVKQPNHKLAGFPLECAGCHNTSQWSGAPFDHNKTQFPLAGAHVAAQCASCHGDGVYRGRSSDCASCHKPDYDRTTGPAHAQAGYPLACASCHNVTRWEDATFDHNQTLFPLSGAHVAAQCAACHGDNIFKGKPVDCASCHRPDYDGTRAPNHAAARISTECASCHSTNRWTEATFDHARTRFPLTGAHVAAQCAACHGDGVYQGKGVECQSCHRADYQRTSNPNHVALGYPLACGNCHNVTRWEDAAFDHNRTRFPLTGSHVAAQCAACHGDGIYQNKPTDCASCHHRAFDNSRDPNHAAAGFANTCATCHNTARWTDATFDHTRTSFPLTGAHVAAQCASCHGDNIFNGKSVDCASCHRSDYDGTTSPNHVQLGYPTACANCHDTARWRNATFDHGQTRFALTGAHLVTQCAGCHGDGVYRGKSTDCYSCHRPDFDGTTNPNHAAAGFATECATCHNTTTYTDATYDHGRTRFPLTGAHVAAQCASCHGDNIFPGKTMDCYGCHQPQYDATTTPPHAAAAYPTACATCHTTSGWLGAGFDHGRTQFPLTGAHVAAACASCHGDGIFAGRSTDCYACHRPDFDQTSTPPHAAAGFATQCATCHNTTRFTDAEFDHGRTRFPLTGAHVAAACAGCHGDGVYGGKSTDCYSCHRPDYDGTTTPPHTAAGFATACATCHNTTRYTDAVYDHGRTDFPLTGAHAAAQCASCHGDGVYNGKSTDCYSCHRPDYEASTNPNHAQAGYPTACASCHNTTRWADGTFDHGATRFPLTGAHVAAQCASCHGDGIFAGKATDCYSCHRPKFDQTTDPPHAAAGFGNACVTCHNTTRWEDGAFNHDTQTSFPLTGAHIAAQCASCHGDGIYNGKSTDCYSCHRPKYDQTTEPPHAAAGFATACATCHNTTRWEDAVFNHDTQTSFPLTGAHIAAQCASCHGDGIYNGKSTDCYSCHRPDYDRTSQPAHAAAGYPTTCVTCHNTTRWEDAVFNHNTTRFPLTGAHVAAQCASCHGDGVYGGKSTDCYSCHRPKYDQTTDPPHAAAGFSTLCGNCHNTTRWDNATFNHSATRFPLTGAHVAAQCASCHGDGVYHGKTTDCYACHRPKYDQTTDPPHAASGFPTTCVTCHNTTRWEDAVFNHSTTRFPLTGAHIAAQCAACHGDGVYRGKTTDCYGCHRPDFDQTRDPQHAAAGFATACATCHNTTRWEDGTYNHNATSFPLTGAHIAAQCASCHGDNIFGGKSVDCYSCHRPDFQGAQTPPHVASGFPTTCTTCHNTTRWEDATFNHATTSFPLTGAHIAAQCASCHGDGVYNGKSTDCYSCHQTDYSGTSDPPHHASGFATTCATCHNTTRWEDAVFNHTTQTSFPLTGAHLAVQCAGCHGDGVYNGKSTDCNSCHHTDYVATTTPPHQSAGFPTTCLTCHTTTRWEDATFNHSTTRFPLTGAHIAAQCASCHGDGVYRGKTTDCYACHTQDYATSTNPPHATVGFPHDCASCHNTTQWDGATFNHDAQWFPIYSGRHRGKWTLCADCHNNSGNFTQFNCLGCHPHSDKAKTDGDHRGRSGYSYTSAACYNCHPQGRS